MNMHMSISMRRNTARPKKSALLISIIAPQKRARSSSSERTQRSIVRNMTIAGTKENNANNHMRWPPKSVLPNITIHR